MHSNIFVNDIRAINNDSLNLIPRIETYEELKNAFRLSVDIGDGEQRATTDLRYWKLIGFEVQTGAVPYISLKFQRDYITRGQGLADFGKEGKKTE